MPAGTAVWTPLAVVVHVGVVAWATPVTPRTAVDIPIVLTASRPSVRRGGDASCTSDSLAVPDPPGREPGRPDAGGRDHGPCPRNGPATQCEDAALPDRD